MSGNYSPTGPFINASAPGISASFLNNVESVFYRRSGDNENGVYLWACGSYSTGSNFGGWIGCVSRSTPVSVAIDTSIVLAGYAAPTTTQLGKSGFNINAVASGVSTTCRFGGAWTINY
jgi:hypothetical protein